MRRPTTLASRLTVMSVLLVAMIGLLVTVTTTLVMRQYLTSQLDASVDAASARGGRGPDGGHVPPNHVGDPDTDGDGGFGAGDEVGALRADITTTSGSGGVLEPGTTTIPNNVALDAAAVADLRGLIGDPGMHTLDLGSLGDYRVLVRVTAPGAATVTGLPTGELDDAVTSMLRWQLLLTLVGVVLAALLATGLVRRTLKPLRQVARTAHEVSEIPLDTGTVGETARVPAALTDPSTEVGQVGAALNRLLGHVESALDARHESELRVRQFVADASHELRTPLSTIMGYAELARRSPSYDANEALAKVEAEGTRMRDLVEDLLLLARLDSGRPLEREEVDLTRLALEAVADARVVDPERRWTLDLPEEPVAVVGDAPRLHQVLSNLLTNAQRHTPGGTRVTVGLRTDGDDAILEVVDDGPGIPAPQQATIFERFTRGDSSRTRSSGGAGLGLALVEAITHAHGGSVLVDSVPGHTSFSVRLPRTA